jgi:hypothetical protein
VRCQALAFWVLEPGAGEIRPVRLPEPGAGDPAGRTLRSGISRVTETPVFRGHSPENQYDALRAAFREGDSSGPVPYDYLSVGVVKHGPPLLRGGAVFSLYPHHTVSVVPARAVVLAPDDAKVQWAWLGDADLRRQLRHAAEERHVTRSGWSATADQISRVTAEAV